MPHVFLRIGGNGDPMAILNIKYLPDQIVTSALTSLEVLLVPLRDGDVVLAAQDGALRTLPAGQ